MTCCFRAVTISKVPTAALGSHLRSVVEVIRRSLPRGSKRCQLAFHEGLKTFFDSLAPYLARQERISEAETDIPDAAPQVKESVRDLMGISLTDLSVQADPTETVRMVRAQSVLAFGRISPGVREKTQNEEILKTLSRWLSVERSSQVQGILRQAQDAFVVTS